MFAPVGMNDAGAVVGWGLAGQAYLYQDGQFNLLADLAGMDPMQQALIRPQSINASGQVVCLEVGTRPGYPQPYLVTPIPEPATAGVLALAAGAMLGRRRT